MDLYRDEEPGAPEGILNKELEGPREPTDVIWRMY